MKFKVREMVVFLYEFCYVVNFLGFLFVVFYMFVEVFCILFNISIFIFFGLLMYFIVLVDLSFLNIL